MDIAWGIVLVALGLLGWLGQLVAALSPATGVRLGLIEAEASVEPVYWADIRGEAAWDSLTLWVLPLAGLLLMVGEPAWAIAGLVGGGVYTYFAGRGIAARLEMRRRGFHIGSESSVRIAFGALAVWLVAALVTIVSAAAALWPES